MQGPGSAGPLLSVVVLAWDQLAATRRCVESVRDHTDVTYELIVVDNGSAPEAAEYAASAADVAVLNETNLGFAAGMNAGLAAARGEFVAFLNNDTAVPERWASTLLSTFADHPRTGIVLPAVTAAGNPFSVRHAPGAERVTAPPFRSLPSGVVYVLERATAQALGGWDERYGQASGEDLDLLWAVWVNGLDVVLDERVLVDHVGGASVDTIPGKTKLYRDNRLLFTERWSSPDPGAPYLGRVDRTDFHRRLDAAAIAATWMRRAFLAEDAAKDARRELRKLEQQRQPAEGAEKETRRRRRRRRSG